MSYRLQILHGSSYGQSEQIPEIPEIPENIRKYQKIPENTRKYQKIQNFTNVQKNKKNVKSTKRTKNELKVWTPHFAPVQIYFNLTVPAHLKKHLLHFTFV